MAAKTMSWPSCPPTAPLPSMLFFVVECLYQILALSFSFLQVRCVSYLAHFARLEIERQRICMDPFPKMVLVSCLLSCHNASDRFALLACPQAFDLALMPFPDLKAGSVNACRLTMRAADKWESPRFQAVCWLEVGSDKMALSSLRPLAANAPR